MDALLAKGAQINQGAGDGDGTVLDRVAAKCTPATVTYLIQHGADVNAVDSQGRTPLALADAAGRTDNAQLLTAAGAH
jgi:ankyrin repeat protein